MGNVPDLIRRVCAVVPNKPVIVAGPLDRVERIRSSTSKDALGFTVGTALLDSAFPTSPDLAQQIGYVQTIVR
ncbi:hypothetical protein GRO01_11060 [Gluconobacter roseus NBRC 3990]|uniref:Uncharacterized protein n=1 Tax=Gluconobacter roseus NBRC 3990 TaxID=1307950 RepID=A0A4Y3M2K5_9PROT|nr:hypothetical protein AA3990_1890 [Gluconobacter roseus NBRC 3990]GEB03530.1 hypothetical protein GRO01_11060 [Gluconobacter roseus NBRC 3990]GLP93985.1 hypothetical protein GCM10007871_19630 [Gluconobacter roseus NBRC 3990]